MEISIKSLFPTLIGSFNDPHIVSKISPIAENALKTNSKKWGYKNTFNDISAHKLIDSHPFIKKYILEIGNQYLNSIGYKPPYPLDSKIFFSEMEKGSHHMPHIHDNSLLSGVIYLEVPKDSSPIIFYDPRTVKYFNNLIEVPNNPLNQTKMYFIPKTNDILIWESWIRHEVPPNNSEGRKTLVFNIGFKQ